MGGSGIKRLRSLKIQQDFDHAQLATASNERFNVTKVTIAAVSAQRSLHVCVVGSTSRNIGK